MASRQREITVDEVKKAVEELASHLKVRYPIHKLAITAKKRVP